MSIESVANNIHSIVEKAKDNLGKSAVSGAAPSKSGSSEASNSQASKPSNDSVSLSDQASEIAGSGEASEASIGTDTSEYSDDVESLARRLVGDEGDTSEVSVAAGTDGNDEITVTGGKDGSVIVNINGEETTYSKEEAEKLIIDAGNGDDTITVDENVKNALAMTGGNGDDAITGGGGNDTIMDNYGSNTISGRGGNDTLIANGNASEDKGFFGRLWDKVTGKVQDNTISGGEGNDYIEGGFGDDSLAGGEGNDVIYGLSGDDAVAGGAGDDYIDAGRGEDYVNGGAGNDRLFGGRGKDQINGSDGDDVIVGGRGADQINGGDGADEITGTNTAFNNDQIATDGDDRVAYVDSMNVPSNINVSGDRAFKERVESDLDSLSDTWVGQAQMQGIAETGHSVDIQATVDGNVCGMGSGNNNGVGADSTVSYNTSKIALGGSSAWAERPPVVGLFHEMNHAYNAAHGNFDSTKYDYSGNVVENGTSGGEFQAVGIDNGTVELNPTGISENDLRAFLNLARRERY